jgi:hypothetical protein
VLDERGELVLVQHHLPSPDAVLGAPEPAALPGISYDPGYRAADWFWRVRRPWLMRVATTLSPRWPSDEEKTRLDVDTRVLNSALLRELVRSIRADGAAALLVYLPHWHGSDELAHATLEASGLAYRDATECVLAVPERERRVPSGNHYADAGNRALAACTATWLSEVGSSIDHL